ncbi:MAG: DUF5671 domain-containing protein [Paracoccaceae bacterium]|jgi:hypothetical protein|nr:DUF5671 domain-containing protein [Paracoccaceae bacterium]
MSNSDRLSKYVETALDKGMARDDIAGALASAGWSPTEISEGLGAWAESSSLPPVPRPQPYVSAKESFLYAITFVSLAMTAWNINWLGFELIDYFWPEPHDSEFYFGETRWTISTLIVFLPLFLFMNFKVLDEAGKDPARRRSTVRKWFGYVTLFIAAGVLVGDLVFTLNALLSGDLTLRVILKVALLGGISALVFVYFRGEMNDAEE